MGIKVISRFLFPLPVICELLVLGLILLWFTRKQKAAKVLLTIGTVMLLILGNRVASGLLLRPLEQEYDPPTQMEANAKHSTDVMYVAVLGASYYPDPQIDLASRIPEGSVVRLLKGIQLCRSLKGCRLILSGGPPEQAETLGTIALSLGIKKEQVILEPHSTNTEQEALLIRPIVGEAPFYLVTSASHMPRAMALFRKRGMNPIADPTDYVAKRIGRITPDSVYPSSGGLYESQRAVYEALGTIWESLRGEM